MAPALGHILSPWSTGCSPCWVAHTEGLKGDQPVQCPPLPSASPGNNSLPEPLSAHTDLAQKHNGNWGNFSGAYRAPPQSRGGSLGLKAGNQSPRKKTDWRMGMSGRDPGRFLSMASALSGVFFFPPLAVATTVWLCRLPHSTAIPFHLHFGPTCNSWTPHHARVSQRCSVQAHFTRLFSFLSAPPLLLALINILTRTPLLSTSLTSLHFFLPAFQESFFFLPTVSPLSCQSCSYCSGEFLFFFSFKQRALLP